MAQTILNAESGELLIGLNNDIEAALRYLDGAAIDKEHVERWRDVVKQILDGRIVHPHSGGRKRRVTAAAA
jgi:hypothetical protein